MKLVGEPPDQGSIYPIVAKIPPTVDTNYLKQHLIPRELIERLRDELLTETIVWSIEESERIASGKQVPGEPLALTQGIPSSEAVQTGKAAALPAPSREDDPLVQQPQLTWIVRTFCGGSQEKVQKVCSDFQVASPDQLRMSHFRQLVGQMQTNGQR
jgi:hypothetical protein